MKGYHPHLRFKETYGDAGESTFVKGMSLAVTIVRKPKAEQPCEREG
tara:strand:+ start:1244 stop:1384 length:141 start_codon:yes stop_codon:yes gene_type:complete